MSVIHDRYGLVRNINEILAYSARPHSWAEISGDVWFWRAFLPQGKDDLFPGLTALGLVAIAILVLLTRRSSSPIISAAPDSAPSSAMSGFRACEEIGRAGLRFFHSYGLSGLSSDVVSGFSRTRLMSLIRLGLAVATLASLVAIAIALSVGPWSVTVAGVLIRMRDLNRAILVAVVCGIPLLLMTRRIREALLRRSPFVFYTAMTPVIALFCCGPALHVGDDVLLSPAPYSWLMILPGFNELRVPPRFWMLGILCLSVAAGLAFRHLRPKRTPLFSAVFLIAAAGLMVDGWMPALRMARPPALWPDVEIGGRPEPLLELPIGPDWDWDATFRAVGHRRRVFNGVSGYDPPHYNALRTGLDGHDPAMLVALASLGPFDVVVNRAADPDGALAQYVSAGPGAVRVADDGARILYRVPQGPPERGLGEVLPIAKVEGFRHDELFASTDKIARETYDGKIETGWGDFPQQPGQWLVIDLGQVREVGGLTQTIGDYFLDFPRRLAIEVSSDGTAWERVWEGPTASHAFLALVRGPREGALRFTFDRRTARFVRLLQLDRYSSMWRVSEVQVHAPSTP